MLLDPADDLAERPFWEELLEVLAWDSVSSFLGFDDFGLDRGKREPLVVLVAGGGPKAILTARTDSARSVKASSSPYRMKIDS